MKNFYNIRDEIFKYLTREFGDNVTISTQEKLQQKMLSFQMKKITVQQIKMKLLKFIVMN